MACLNEHWIINRKYVKIAKENNEDIYQYEDRVDFYVPIKCGRCLNCINSYMTAWRNRLLIEYEYMSSEQRNNSTWFTLTFSNENLVETDKGFTRTRFPPRHYKRQFIDILRKRLGYTPRHWIVTEFGEDSNRFHMHGIFFDYSPYLDELQSAWKFGIVDIQPLHEDAIKYVTSYITKRADDIIIDPAMIQHVFCSPGIGKAYSDDSYNQRWHRKDNEPIPVMLNSSGYLQALPRYLRTKLFTDDEREDLSMSYFANLSPDVIPDPPYKIGKTIYEDYTLYLEALKKHQKRYHKLYRSKHKNTIIYEQPKRPDV